jgi:hypothetical protein
MSTPAAQVPIPTEVPCPAVLVQAAKFAIEQDRPILLDYFLDTFTGKAFLGEYPDTKEKILIKLDGEEYTSLISKLYKVGADYVILTENSVYITSGKMSKRTLNKDKKDMLD